MTVIIAEAGTDKKALPDNVCVYLNGNPVTGAYVDDGGFQKGTTGAGGCASFNISGGTYCVFATYGSYQGCTSVTFTPSNDLIVINLAPGPCNCGD